MGDVEAPSTACDGDDGHLKLVHPFSLRFRDARAESAYLFHVEHRIAPPSLALYAVAVGLSAVLRGLGTTDSPVHRTDLLSRALK